MKLDYVTYREDDNLCGWHGKVLGSMSSPHITTCWCYDGYVGDGFHCAGMAMSSLRSLQSFSCVFSFVIPEVKDTAARKLSRCETRKRWGRGGGGGRGEKTIRKSACIQPLLSQDWKGRFRLLYIMPACF